jgi:MFS family permease
VGALRVQLDRLTGAPPAAFWWLWSGAFVSALATFVLPFLALFLRSRGFAVETIGSMGALFGVGVLLSSPVAGALADHLGRRPTMIGALLCTAAATAALAFATRPLAISAGILAVGIANAAYRPAALALVADVVLPEARTRAYGMLRWANNLGLAVSSVLGGALASLGYGKLFLVDAGTTFAFALVIALRVPETRPALPAPSARTRRTPLPAREALFLLAFLALQLGLTLPLWQFQVTLPLAMARQGHGPAVFGRVLAVNGVLITLLQPAVAAWTARHDAARLLAGGTFLVGLGYGAYAVCHGALAFGAATAVWSLGEIAFMPVASATVAALSPVALRGRYQGAWSLVLGLGMVAAPVLGSACMERLGAPVLWGACLALGVATAGGFLLLGPGLRRRSPGGHAGGRGSG